jgi:hypothetical protein
MIKLRNLDGLVLGFGFDWKTVSSSQAEKTIKEECKKNGDKFSYSIAKASDDDSNVTIYTTIDELYEPKTVPAAHLLYNALIDKDDFIYIYPINDDQAWVCCVSQNEIVSNGDLIVSITNIKDELAKLSKALGTEDLGGFLFYIDSKLESIDSGYDADFYLDFSEVVNSTDLVIKKLTFAKVHSQKDNLIKAALVLAFAVGGGYYLFGDELTQSTASLIEQPKKVDTDKLLKKLPQMKSRDAGDFIDKSITKSDDVVIQEARRQELEWLNDDLSLLNEATFIEYLHDTLYKEPARVAGWRLAKVTFDVSFPTALEYQYIKTRQGTALTLKEEYVGTSIVFSPNGSVANIFKPIDQNFFTRNNVKFQDLVKKEHNVINLMHDLDINSLNWSMSKLNLTDRQEPIEGLRDSSKENERQLKTDSREIIVKGKFLSEILQAKKVFSSTDKFLLERVVVNIGSDISWTMYGVYHNNFLK